MIEIKERRDCCGCNACVQRCPKQCITMQADNEGFLYPIIDATTCIDCGICEKVCPVINQNEPRKPLKVYAAYNKNEQVRMQSSSGGIFTLLAEETIKKGGVVFGVKFNKDWMPEFDYTETIEGIAPLRGSKYVQAIVGNAYKQAENFLKAGREVLFCGTPCQIAGLKLYLRKEYNNLLSVDIICHGVPSPGLWNRYLNEKYQEHCGDNPADARFKKIESINFRHKYPLWNDYSFCIKYKGDIPQHRVRAAKDPYMQAFLLDIVLRPSCYDCPAKGGKSFCDIKICDFWGIEKIMPECDVEKGIGGVIIYTEKGLEAVSLKDIVKKEYLLDDITRQNPSYYNSCVKPSKRDFFFKRFDKCDNVVKLLTDSTVPSNISKLKKTIKRCLAALKRYI